LPSVAASEQPRQRPAQRPALGRLFLKADGRTARFVGNTGYEGEIFPNIRHGCGAPEPAKIPIGAYEPRRFTAEQHCNPEAAVKIHLGFGAKLTVGMHWGALQLTDEAREAPVTALSASLAAPRLPFASFRAVAPGENIVA
jgi:L-ascorbate metabolism protein UlaG (beta-lactamase superfamily)